MQLEVTESAFLDQPAQAAKVLARLCGLGVRIALDDFVQMGQAIGLELVAEGVEIQEHLRALIAVRCGSVQGYLLGRPMPTNRVTAVLNQQLGKE